MKDNSGGKNDDAKSIDHPKIVPSSEPILSTIVNCQVPFKPEPIKVLKLPEGAKSPAGIVTFPAG